MTGKGDSKEAVVLRDLSGNFSFIGLFLNLFGSWRLPAGIPYVG